VDQPELQSQVRVILVGRTGLDAALRLDPGVELLRVRTALEAIGELSDPIDESSPSRAVIVIGSDAEPPVHVNGHGAGREDFLKAARLVDPKVRVLRAIERGTHADAITARAYDGIIDPDFSAHAVSSIIHGRVEQPSQATPYYAPPAARNGGPPVAPGVFAAPLHRPAAPAAADTPTGSAVPAAAPATVPEVVSTVLPTDRVSTFADAALVRVLLRGGDLAAPAIELLRSRTSDLGVRFIPRGEAAPEGAPPVLVACDGVTYGHLWSDRTLPEELRLNAQWLALWLRLGDQQAQLREAAFTDALTGAWNRRYFDRYLTAAIARARGSRQPVTVMCFDIDDFKRFNDAFGHAAADEILTETVRLLRSVIRPSDRVCRVGGDEFAVIFHEPGGPRKAGSTPPTTVFDIARRFQEQIAQSRFPKLGVSAPGTLTVSGGLATFPWDGSTPDELIRHADLLAMESKRAGKNAIVFGPNHANQ